MLPMINAEVELRAPDGGIIAAQIAFVTATYAAIERPADHPQDDVPDDSLYELMWASTSGVHVQPVLVTERPGRGNTLIWEATATGDSRVEQRRAFARVPLTAPMTITDLTLADDPSGATEPQEALLLDVSEAALRCTVYGRRWADMENGDPIAVDFRVDDTGFQSRGRVLRVRQYDGDPAIEVIVMLDADLAFTAALRRAVLAEQRRAPVEESEIEAPPADLTPHEPAVPGPRQRKWWQLR